MPSEFEPFEYQQYTIDRMIREKHLGLFYRMGAGKTVITLTALNELIYRRFEVNKALIIAPKFVAQDTWVKESAEWPHLSLLRMSLILGSEKKRIEAVEADADVYVINRENVLWLTSKYPGKRWPFDCVVFDELSSFKNPSAIRFKKIRKMLPLISRTYGLTGTPGNYLNLWSEVYLLDQGERLGRTFTSYRNKYFEPDRRGNGIVYSYKLRAGAKEEIDRLIADICISLRPDDYAKLPPIVYDDLGIHLNATAARRYMTMERESLIEIGDSEITAQVAAVVTGKLLQIASGAVYDDTGQAVVIHDQKIEALKDLLSYTSGPSLVFYNFKHERDRILETFAGKPIRIAEIKDDGAIDRWNAGEIDLLLAHPASAAYGLNLQRGGHDVIWFSPTWNLELYEQANARLYRTGQQYQVKVTHLIARGTVDEDVMESLTKKDKTQRSLLESLKRKINDYGINK